MENLEKYQKNKSCNKYFILINVFAHLELSRKYTVLYSCYPTDLYNLIEILQATLCFKVWIYQIL